MSRARRAGPPAASGPGASTRAAVEGGKLAPIYLLYGNEPGPARDVVAAIRKAVLQPGLEAFNHERFAGRELDGVGIVLDSCGQLPAMASHRLVELSDPETIGKGRGGRKEDLDALVAYFGSPNPTTVLVVTSSGIDGRSRLVTAAKKGGGVVEKFEAPKRDADAVDYVMELADREGTTLSRQVANRLVELVGTGLSALASALSSAALHAGAGAAVTMADLDAVVAHTREAVIFELTDAVGMGDGPKALGVLAHMFRERTGTEIGQANAALSMLIRQIRLVATAKATGTGAMRVPPFVARKLDGQVQQWNERRLRRALAGLARLDRDLKGGSATVAKAPYLALQRWVLDACSTLPAVAARV
jgi:DNA polymerase-3 subunit delta